MPRHQKAKKDVAGCEKPRGVASELWSGDIWMGRPSYQKGNYPEREANSGNWKILVPEGREIKRDFLSSASEEERAQTYSAFVL